MKQPDRLRPLLAQSVVALLCNNKSGIGHSGQSWLRQRNVPLLPWWGIGPISQDAPVM